MFSSTASFRLARYVFVIAAVALGAAASGAERLSLDGEWRFAMNAPAPSFPQGALPEFAFSDTIVLPGTTETRNKGPENAAGEEGMLTRVRKFDGAAWYQREVDIPANWMGRKIELHLERTKYTQVWFDSLQVGEQGLYTASQPYDLTRVAAPGKHRITIMVDNRAERRPVQAEAHQFSDNTQTNWNGLIGKLELVAFPPLWLDDVQIYPDLEARSFRLHIVPGQQVGRMAEGRLTVHAESFNHEGPSHRPAAVGTTVAVNSALAGVDLVLPLGEGAKLWDEYTPALYRVTVEFEGPNGSADQRVIETGLREFKTIGTHFAVNGRPTFLRGKHDGCVFPLTGHPPMDVEGWLAYLRICQSYGINHIRCHTWVPPEAAFAAADRLGIYLQPELPFWGGFDEKARAFLLPEAHAVLRAYGNHPSFAMLTLGNELSGDRAMMNAMVTQLRNLDSRHLYADGSNNYLWDPRHQATNDFWPTARLKPALNSDKSLPVRGSYFFMDGYDGPVQWGPANTRGDFREAIATTPVPVIGHEIAQYTVYPDFNEIPRYTGVTRARNFERFQMSLNRHGMSDRASDFFRASAALTASLYREDIEYALRTPGFGGFQLLDLQDFPGQGTALVGVLNAFMESKGAVTPERWKEFCSSVVPLARFDRYTWTTADTFSADLELAHYGVRDLRDAVTSWRIVGNDGETVATGKIDCALLVQGGLRSIGPIHASLGHAKTPARYELVVTVSSGADAFTNRWPLWIYPAEASTQPDSNVTVVRAFDARAQELLAAGKRVVLIPQAQTPWGYTQRGAYATDFWCWPMFGSSPGTMGIVCDPKHPALAQFPTAFHSERQWSAINHASTPVILSSTPGGFHPIVQVIDNLERNDKLGLVFETQVGPGSLLVIACDLYALKDAPEARQLLKSVLSYAASKDFAPKTKLAVSVLDGVLRPSLALGGTVTTSSAFAPPWGFVPTPASAVDADLSSRWQAKDDDKQPQLAVDLGRACDVDTVELLWEHDLAGYQYVLESSIDGAKWIPASDQRANTFTGGRHTLPVALRAVKHLRVSISGWPKSKHAAVRDFRVLGNESVVAAK